MKRDDFVTIINERGFAVGVELGVATGCFSQTLSTSNLKELVLVDKWNDHHTLAEKAVVEHKFANDPRVTILHTTFQEASLLFPDGYFDFIYIDGYAHTGQDGGQTLDLWWPKLSEGGMFSGHDYDKMYQPTINSVNTFCQKHNLELQLTDEPLLRSWYLFK